jgi:protein TonB
LKTAAHSSDRSPRKINSRCNKENLMFDQTFVNTHAQTRRPWTVAASLTLQTALVGLVILLPMLHPEILRPKPLEMPIYLPLRAVPQPPPELKLTQRASSSAPRVFTSPPVLTMPTSIPTHASMIADDAPSMPMVGAISGGQYVGLPDGVGLPDRITPLPETRPAPTPKPAPPAGPVHVSTGVQAARLIFGPKPPYPPLAKAARVQGNVRLQAVIAPNGTIRNLHVMSGPPLLVNAALAAVQQWRYQPTLLSGNAVEVITEIDVNFTLSQ